MLKAVSVGFTPGEWKWRDKRGEGIDFVSGHQLLEASVVNVRQILTPCSKPPADA